MKISWAYVNHRLYFRHLTQDLIQDNQTGNAKCLFPVKAYTNASFLQCSILKQFNLSHIPASPIAWACLSTADWEGSCLMHSRLVRNDRDYCGCFWGLGLCLKHYISFCIWKELCKMMLSCFVPGLWWILCRWTFGDWIFDLNRLVSNCRWLCCVIQCKRFKISNRRVKGGSDESLPPILVYLKSGKENHVWIDVLWGNFIHLH